MTAGRVALLALVVLCAVSLPWLVHPYFDPHWDATLYVLTTRSLLAGEGYAVFGEPLHLRPPGFSFLLVPVLAFFGTNFHVLNLFVAGWGIVALALLFLYFRPRLGIPTTLALCACLWMNPQYRKICNSVLSDTVGLAFLLLCLLLDRWARARPTLGRHAVLGLALGLSLYLRSVCILLIPAFVLARFLKRCPESPGIGRKLGHMAVLIMIPLLLQWPWSAWKEKHPAPIPSDQAGLHSYWTAQWHAKAWNPDSPVLPVQSILERVPLRWEQCASGLGGRLPSVTLPMLHPGTVEEHRRATFGPGDFWFGCVGVAALLIVALRRRDAGNLFAMGNLAVLLIYFDYDERILLPSYLFVLAAVLELLRAGLQRFLPARGAIGLVVLLLVALTWVDREDPTRRKAIGQRHMESVRVARLVKRKHREATVAASLGHVFAVYLERPVYFLELAAMRQRRQGVERVILEHDVDVVVHTGRNNRYIGWWLEPLLDQHGEVSASVGQIRVFRLKKHGREE